MRSDDRRRVSVLFAHRRSVYWDLPVIVYDERRDARTFRGLGPVIAHPPCRLWCRLRAFSTAPESEKSLAWFALEVVRRNGGVLEHPAHSRFWEAAALPPPVRSRGEPERDAWGGWTLAVCQKDWGHRAEKPTWLYIVGCPPQGIPELPLVLGKATHSCGRSRRRDRPSLEKDERDLTPVAFAWWLEELASRCAPAGGSERPLPLEPAFPADHTMRRLASVVRSLPIVRDERGAGAARPERVDLGPGE